MAQETNTEELLSQLIQRAGSADKALEAIQAAQAKAKTSLARKSIEGAATLTVNDWDRLEMFVVESQPDHNESTNFVSICRSVKEAAKNRDAEALLLGLMLSYRITRGA
jgi:hypothetical protein